jgi:hypothetical protein
MPDAPITYDSLLKVLTAQKSDILKTGNWQGPIIVVKDNSDIWFYFDKNNNLIHVRAY